MEKIGIKKIRYKDIKHIRYHDSLSEVLVERIKKMYPVISEVFPDWSCDYWVDGFCYDMYPEAEVSIWERIIQKFEFECKIRGARSREQKAEILSEILGPPILILTGEKASA